VDAITGGIPLSKRLAIIDDDYDVRSMLQNSLTADGYSVTALSSGVGIESFLAKEPHDLVLVDVGLPELDGLTLTRRLRENFDIGIIIISGRGDLTDRIVGLEVGADDYVTKPFELKEVHARIRSVLRRQERERAIGPAHRGELFYFGVWLLDVASRTLRDRDGNAVGLTTGEYRLLETLVRRPNRVLSRAYLLDAVHDNDSPAFDRSVDVAVARLRKKLGDDSKTPEMIKTVRNGGYIFVSKVETRTR
jgi:two-component system, OmpR family, response regulator